MADFKMNTDPEGLRKMAEREDGCIVSVGGFWVTAQRGELIVLPEDIDPTEPTALACSRDLRARAEASKSEAFQAAADVEAATPITAGSMGDADLVHALRVVLAAGLSVTNARGGTLVRETVTGQLVHRIRYRSSDTFERLEEAIASFLSEAEP